MGPKFGVDIVWNRIILPTPEFEFGSLAHSHHSTDYAALSVQTALNFVVLIHQSSPYSILFNLIDFFRCYTVPIASPCSIVQTSEITIKKKKKENQRISFSYNLKRQNYYKMKSLARFSKKIQPQLRRALIEIKSYFETQIPVYISIYPTTEEIRWRVPCEETYPHLVLRSSQQNHPAGLM
jgi:hypothetical protein